MIFTLLMSLAFGAVLGIVNNGIFSSVLKNANVYENFPESEPKGFAILFLVCIAVSVITAFCNYSSHRHYSLGVAVASWFFTAISYIIAIFWMGLDLKVNSILYLILGIIIVIWIILRSIIRAVFRFGW